MVIRRVGVWSVARLYGAMFGIFAIIGLPILYGVMGVIAGGIGAALYNLFAGIFGGVEVELDSGTPGFNSQFVGRADA
jgi:hypothetical protein